MNPARVRRATVRTLTDLPNVGAATAADLRLLGINEPRQLAGRDAWDMYDALCRLTGARHDPCVIDVFLSLVDFAKGGEPRPWWHYTGRRKAEQAIRAAASS
ncbi:MAG: helix-hairpin-helix domain-containing protein [Xanthomonadaceae bacterium]|nr:helix-hairpin-helix domain-containing protein [Xanthomonadaceae bacterium]